MKRKVRAGATAVGTKVQAKLTVATLVGGVVIPEGAILSGEVTESVAKSDSNPSRLSIRMDSVQWKNGSASSTIAFAQKVYLTAWYYPLSMLSQNSADDALKNLNNPQRRNGALAYPGATPKDLPPFQRPDQDKDPDLTPVPPAPNTAQHRALMKDVESSRTADGGVALTSSQRNIGLDGATTYVFAAGSSLPAK